MKKKSKDYWIQRALEDENKSNLKAIETYKKQERVLKNTELELKNIIEKYLHDMSWHNNLSMTKMKEILDKKEKEELNWILQDYILYAKEYEKYLKNSPEAKELDRKLKNASRNFRMTKEQAMLTEVRKELVKLGVEQNKVLENHLKETVQETRESNNLPKLPVKEEPLKLEDKSQENATPLSENFKTVDEAINEKWVGGKNFSERIWKDTDRLNKYLEEELPKSISRGDAGKKLINDIEKQFEVSKANAKRLVFTETSRIYSKTRLKSFMDLGVKFVEILATLDLRTSEICRNKDGLKIEIANAKIGVDLPPYHPYCRTTFTPVLDEDLEKKLNPSKKRSARDPVTNKTYTTDAKNYKEWYENNIKNNIDDEQNRKIKLNMLENKDHEIIRLEEDELERKLPRLSKQKETVVREKEDITIFKAIGTINEIYFERKTKETFIIEGNNNKNSVKKAIKYIDDSLTNAFELMNIDKVFFGNLKIVIMAKENKFASYSPKDNIMYINPIYLGSEEVYMTIFNSGALKDLTNSNNVLSTYIHELTHSYEHKYYKIKNKTDKILELKKKNLRLVLDFAKKRGYHINEKISVYAFENRYDISELLAEAYTRKKIGKTNMLIEYILELYELGDD